MKSYIANFSLKLKTGDTNSEAERQRQAIAAMETELAKQERMKKRLFDSWEADDGTYTREEFIERKGMYTQTIENLRKEIAEMKKVTPAPVDYEERISTLHAMIDCLIDPSVDARSKNTFLKSVIDKIELDTIDLGKGKGATPVLDIHFK